jgi:hypothetical protein
VLHGGHEWRRFVPWRIIGSNGSVNSKRRTDGGSARAQARARRRASVGVAWCSPGAVLGLGFTGVARVRRLDGGGAQASGRRRQLRMAHVREAEKTSGWAVGPTRQPVARGGAFEWGLASRMLVQSQTTCMIDCFLQISKIVFRFLFFT